MSNRLLLAEGDPKSLRVLDVSLRSAGFDVETATAGADAWAMLERHLPDVVIAAADLGAIDGFELCARLRARPDAQGLPFLLLLGADPTVEQKVKGLQAGADEYLVKPVLVNDLVARVRALVRRRDRDRLASDISPAAPFSGNLNDLTPVDLMEVVAAGQRSGIIHLRDLRGSPGTIYFRRGAIVDAEVGRLSGQDAIGRLFSWSQGTFEVDWKSIRRADVIGKPAAELVLDGMRRLDDWNRLTAQLPDLHDVFEVNYRILAERLAEIPDEVNGVLRLFDGARSLAHVVEDSLLPDLDALGMVIRLRDEGIIRNLSQRKAARSRSSDDARAESAPDELSSRMNTASGAVEQSFANRMAAHASGPHRPASVDQAPPPAEDSVDSHPARTRTAPGLGQPLAEPETDPSPVVAPIDQVTDAVPQPRAEESNVIHLPEESKPGTLLPELLPEAESDGLGLSSEGLAEVPMAEPARAQHHTQRGMGPLPPPKTKADARSTDANRPVALPGVAPFPPPPPTAAVSEAPEAEPPASAAKRTTPETLRLESRAASEESAVPSPLPAPTLIEPPPSAERDSDGVVPPNQALRAADETVRVSFPDEALSRREALDELGFPARRRGLRVLGVALAVGVLSAVVVHQLRTQPEGKPAEGAAVPERPAHAERASTPGAAPAGHPPAAGEPAAGKAHEQGAAAPEHPSVSASLSAPAPTHPSAALVEAEAVPATVPIPAPGSTPSGSPSSKGDSHASAPSTGEPAAAHGEPGAPGVHVAPEASAAAKDPGVGQVAKSEHGAPSGAESKAVGDAAPKAAPAPAREHPSAAGTKAVPEPPASGPPKADRPASDFVHLLSDCRTQFLKNRLRDASATCAAALQTNPRSPDALTLMAHVELNRGRMNRANELAQKAVAIDARQADAYVIIGGVHQDSGRIPQAKAAYNHYLELAPHGRYADELRSILGNL